MSGRTGRITKANPTESNAVERSEVSIVLHRRPPQWLRFVGGCSTDELFTCADATDTGNVHQ
jgi:hypothetical protein